MSHGRCYNGQQRLTRSSLFFCFCASEIEAKGDLAATDDLILPLYSGAGGGGATGEPCLAEWDRLCLKSWATGFCHGWRGQVISFGRWGRFVLFTPRGGLRPHMDR